MSDPSPGAAGAPPPAPPPPPEDWVPVEHRLAGLDRRTIAPALGVFVFLVFLAFGLPAIDGALSYDDPIQPGEVIGVGNGVTFVPAVGWDLASGLRVTEETGNETLPPATLVQGSVAISVQADRFEGTSSELLHQIDVTGAGLLGVEDFQLVVHRLT